jgi:hypothetical protein
MAGGLVGSTDGSSTGSGAARPDPDVVVDVDVDDPGVAGIPGARDPEAPRSGKRTMLRFSWDRDDPLAVSIELSSTPDHPALPRGQWIVLRDFLRYGLEEPTGDGAVRISPDPANGAVSIRLARDGRPAWVRAPSDTIRTFLDRTEAFLPSGEESSEEALDALIKALLKA